MGGTGKGTLKVVYNIGTERCRVRACCIARGWCDRYSPKHKHSACWSPPDSVGIIRKPLLYTQREILNENPSKPKVLKQARVPGSLLLVEFWKGANPHHTYPEPRGCNTGILTYHPPFSLNPAKPCALPASLTHPQLQNL